MNEQDPLAQLRDIHLPEPVGWWPPAPGWWLLLALLLAGLALGFWLLYRHRQQNAYRQRARAELEDAWAQLEHSGDSEAYVTRMTQILRRAARQLDPHSAQMQGDAWLEFLDASGRTREFTQGKGRQLSSLPYRPVAPHAELRPLHDLVAKWLAGHRRPEPSRELRSAAV